MSWKQIYKKWSNFAALEQDLKEELQKLATDEARLEDCFYKTMEFGTGGMRGEIGPGPNRMNIYTVRKASAGFAKYIAQFGEDAKRRGVVIAYDCRHKSPEFAMEAAKTLATYGVHTYLFDELRPTPELSFAVRHLNAFGGIVITASHNPPEYNGYKVYGPDGGQLPPEPANELIDKVNEFADELRIEVKDEHELKKAGLIQMIGEEIDQAYNDKLQTILLNKEIVQQMSEDVKIVFTPLHGTANKPVRRALQAAGFQHVTIVTEQEKPDPNFSTVKSPNPEEHAAFELAIKYGEKENADVLIATDPDADRVGIAVKNANGEYVVLTGNQTGALMLEYILSQRKAHGTLPSNGVMLKTIVTSELGRTIADHYGVETVDTLTGFKFIGEKIKQYEQEQSKTFLFGYEESYGYLIGDFARDKDAVQACLLAAEMAAFYKSQGKTIHDALIELYEKYGYYREDLKSLTLKGKQGSEQIANIMTSFRENPPTEVAGEKIVTIEDYKTSKQIHVATNFTNDILLPKSNVLKYILADGSWFCLRPSGTEPKIKFYFATKGKTLAESNTRLENMVSDVMQRVNQ